MRERKRFFRSELPAGEDFVTFNSTPDSSLDGNCPLNGHELKKVEPLSFSDRSWFFRIRARRWLPYLWERGCLALVAEFENKPPAVIARFLRSRIWRAFMSDCQIHRANGCAQQAGGLPTTIAGEGDRSSTTPGRKVHDTDQKTLGTPKRTGRQ